MHDSSINRRSLLSIPVLAAAGIMLSSCGDKNSASAGNSQANLGSIADAKVLADPTTYEGPSTAKLQASSVRPISDKPQPVMPVTLTDAQGTKVEIKDVSRIVPLDIYGSISRIVFDLGLGANVVGRDVSSQFKEIADRPLVTHNGHQLNGEAILALKPTLIITDSSLGPWDTVLQMREAGIPVVVVDSHRSLSSVKPLIMQVAEAVGLKENGEKLAARTQAEIEETKKQIQAAIPKDKRKLRMLFFYARGHSGTYYIFGQESGADELIDALGGVDVATEIGWKGMRPMTDEAFIQAKPDVILMMTKGLESCGGVDGLLDSKPAVALTPAGQHHRIVDMDDADILSFGPNSAQVLNALALAIYAPETKA